MLCSCFSHHAVFLSIGPHSTIVQMAMQNHIDNTFHHVHVQTLKPCCWPAHLTVLIKSMSGPFQYYLWGYQVQTTPHNGMAHSVLETIVNVLHLLTICVTVCSILTCGGPLLHCNINNPEGWLVGWFGMGEGMGVGMIISKFPFPESQQLPILNYIVWPREIFLPKVLIGSILYRVASKEK